MASVVDICNMALSHIGDGATVASIDPPEGSAQAEHCATFYPTARDALLELHPWSWATRRALLTPLESTVSQWAYCYAAPANMITALAVLDSAATDDVATTGAGTYSPQPFVVESLDSGEVVIYTNQADALLKFTIRITDPSRFSPMFVLALSWALAAMIAGPVIKGTAGQAEAARCTNIAFGRDGRGGYFGQAAGADANKSESAVREQHQVAWLAGR